MRFESDLYAEDVDYVSHIDADWKMLDGKTVMITGATGMIGTFLIDVLMQRNAAYNSEIHIIAASRNINKLEDRFKSYKGSEYLVLLKYDVTEKFTYTGHIDHIVHAASNTHPKEYSNDPIGTITTNILGTYNLLEWIKDHVGCKMTLLSSVEIYGENRGDVDRFQETYSGYIDCNTLRAGYPESKRLSESMLQAYQSQAGVESVIVRLCRTYGPTVEPDDTKAISQFIKKAADKQDIVLKSAGTQLYSYIYVSDAVSAILYVLMCGKNGEAYNVADASSDITLKELAEILANEAGTSVVYEIPTDNEKKGYSTATKALLDPAKINKLGWKPRYTMEEGLTRTLKIL
jgi:nucleoside-diphosphate-sugar epimerase